MLYYCENKVSNWNTSNFALSFHCSNVMTKIIAQHGLTHTISAKYWIDSVLPCLFFTQFLRTYSHVMGMCPRLRNPGSATEQLDLTKKFTVSVSYPPRQFATH